MSEPQKRPRHPREPWDVGEAIIRLISRGLVRRCREGDSAAFEELLLIEREFLPEQVRLAGKALHEAGYSYTEIARMAGTTRASAHQRYQ